MSGRPYLTRDKHEIPETVQINYLNFVGPMYGDVFRLFCLIRRNFRRHRQS